MRHIPGLEHTKRGHPMIRKKRSSRLKRTITSKWTWLFLGLCLAAFVVTVNWPRKVKKTPVKSEVVKTARRSAPVKEVVHPRPVEEKVLPQHWPSEESDEPEGEVIKTLQGEVENSDPCIQLLIVDGVTFDAGPVDLTGIRSGDIVRVYYTEKMWRWKKENVLKSLEYIAASQETPPPRFAHDEEPFKEPRQREEEEEFAEVEPVYEPEDAPVRPGPGVEGRLTAHREHGKAEGPEATEDGSAEQGESLQQEELAEEELLEEPGEFEGDSKYTVQGRVTDYDPCFQMLWVEGLLFDGGRVDLAGIRPGDYVEIAYTENEQGSVLSSIVVIESQH
jgi:hypothetical protein